MIDVILPGSLGCLELDDVAGQVGVAVVGSLPGQLDSSARFIEHLKF